MKRRDVLKAGLALTTSLWAASCGGTDTPAPIPEPFAPPLPVLRFLTSDPAFSDYRPTPDPTGELVLFERTPAAGGDTVLFLATGASSSSPTVTRFLFGDPLIQTRPDWSWATGRIAFNGAPAGNIGPFVHLIDPDGSDLVQIANSGGWNYPIWTSDGSQLVVFNNSVGAVPRPHSSLILPDGTILQENLNGTDANGVPMFGGFAAPNPLDPLRIAYAGQPTLPSWVPGQPAGCANDPSGYNQCFNYPFLNSRAGGVFTSAPLEADASIAAYDPSKQGRAPYWSPNGRYLVFESDRLGGYAIFLADTQTGAPPIQLTDPNFEAQHAKWFPDGRRLVLTCLQQAGGPVRGIAVIDISEYVQ